MENEYNIRNIQEGLLEILIDIDKVCRNNNIKYSLYAGTLIGAIRHNGFIPWDDDADIVFERNEYEKFLKVYPLEKRSEYFLENILWIPRVINEDSLDSDGVNPRVFVDILIFDNAPDNVFKLKTKVFLIKFLQGTLKENIDYKKYSIGGKILTFTTYIIGKMFTKRWKLLMYDSISQLGRKKFTYKVGVYNTLFAYLNCSFPLSIVSDYEDKVFEGKNFMIIKGYHDVLSILYGDYMTPPPVEERIPHGR